MYQRYPSGGQLPEPQQGPAPPSVLTAVKLMYAGAALSTITLVLLFATGGTSKTELRKLFPKDTAHQINVLATFYLGEDILIGLLSIALWLWLARACNRGKGWARITGTVIFGLYTLLMLLSVSRLRVGIGILIDLVIWLVGLGVVVLLWRKESSAYFASPPPA